MRITTNMLNESFKKAGLPARGTSLLDYIDSDKASASLLDALNKEQEATINNVEKDKYAAAATWFQYATSQYPVAQVYCDISET